MGERAHRRMGDSATSGKAQTHVATLHKSPSVRFAAGDPLGLPAYLAHTRLAGAPIRPFASWLLAPLSHLTYVRPSRNEI